MEDEKVLEVMIELINDAHSDYDYYKHMDPKKENYKENIKRCLQKISDMLGVTKSIVDSQINDINNDGVIIKLLTNIQTLKEKQNETK